MAHIDYWPPNWTVGTGPYSNAVTPPTGWRCPQCGAVWSPATTGCLNCTGHVSAYQLLCTCGTTAVCMAHPPSRPRITCKGDGEEPCACNCGTAMQCPAHPFGRPCPAPREGGMCGCDEDDDGPQDCLKAHCDC